RAHRRVLTPAPVSAQSAPASPASRWQQLRTRWWRLTPTDAGAVRLTHRRIYILPTRRGWAFVFTLVLMLLGALNYAVSLGFVFIFLLAGMFHAALLQAYRQLRALQLAAGDEPETFVGDVARFGPVVTNADTVTTLHCTLSAADATQNLVVEPQQAALAQLAVTAAMRGRLPLGRITLSSSFPLGLWRAWSYIHFPIAAWVYPQPEPLAPPLPMQGADAGEGHAQSSGHEEFAGLRRYEPGDTPRQIAWKALARGVGLHSKSFAGSARGRCLLDWQQLPATLDTEARLSRLTAWVLAAERAQVDYAITIPGFAAPLAHGSAQREQCLKALALFTADATG
ncbi:MAG: DUF58 domain-containing protein, partial [Betaproteobacteria bacterium]